MDPAGDAEMWTIEPPVTGALVARIFERGSYHVVGRALRYRRGLGGRQPLTPNVFDDDRSGMEARLDRVVFWLFGDGVLQGADTSSAALHFWAPQSP